VGKSFNTDRDNYCKMSFNKYVKVGPNSISGGINNDI